MPIVKVTKTASSDVLTYVNTIKKSTTRINRELFDGSKSITSLTSTCTIFTAYNDDSTIAGILIAKVTKISKRPYLNIILLNADSVETYSSLLEELMGVMNEASVYGIFTSFIPTESQEIVHALLSNRFKIIEAVYGIGTSNLSHKLATKPKLTRVRFTDKNKRQYSQLFSDLLVEYDIDIGTKLNNSIGKDIYPIRLKNRAHRIAISYFVASVAKTSRWYVYLFFDGEELIGFIKAKIGKGQYLCSPEVYIKPEHFAKYAESAMQGFAEEISKTSAESICTIATINDRLLNDTYHRWLGKPLGYSYSFV